MELHREEPVKTAGVSSAITSRLADSLVKVKAAQRPAYDVGQMVVRVVLVYVLVAALWILISDPLLAAFVKDTDLLVKFEIAKGWSFIAVTAALLFLLLRRETTHWTAERIARDEAEKALRESEARFRRLYEEAPVPYQSLDANGRFIEVNQSWLNSLGYERGEVIGRFFGEFMTPESAALIKERFPRFKAAGEIHEAEFELIRKDGTHRIIVFDGRIGHDERGNFLQTHCVFADITERKQAEAALRESQRHSALLADLLEHSSQPFAVGYPDGHLGIFNAAYVQLLGYSEAELRSLDWMRDLTPPEWAEAEQARLAELHRTGQPVCYQKEYFRKDGKRVPVEGLVHEVCDDKGEPAYYYAFITDLTARKEAEAAARKSAERLKFAMEGANDGIWDVDIRTNTAEQSPRGCEIFGYTPDEFKRENPAWNTMVHPDDLPATLAALQEHVCGRTSLIEVEQRVKTKSGEYKWILTRGKISGRDDKGAPIRITGTHTDITARRLAETRIRHLNRVYAVLSEINKTIVRVRAPQTIYAEACRIAVEHGGFIMAWIGLADTPTDRPKISTHAGATAEVLKVLAGAECCFTAQTLETGSHAVCNDIANDPQAEPWREEAVRLGYRAMAAFPLKMEGKVIGTFNFYAGETNFFDAGELRLLDELATDISFAVEVCGREDRRRRIEEANTRLATAVEQADEIIMITSADGTILYVNPAFEKVTGYTAQEAVGRNPRFLQSGAHDQAFFVAMWARLTRGEVWSGRLINKRKDGTRYEEKANISPVRDDKGQIINYVGVKRDVTQEVAMEARLRQAQKMEAIGTLAGGIAHDFNNVLGAITGYTELAKMDSDAPAVKASLEEILRACRRAGDLVRQILTFSRQQEQLRRPIRLWPVIEEATKLLRAALPSTIEFHLEQAEDVPTVLADPTQIHQVIMNLCTNAAYAMKGRAGRFAVKLEKFEVGEEFASLHPGSRPGTYALLSVSDNGQGMERGTLDRIFEPFFTTKPPGEGTGLGLAVVHGIVQNHDGLITVYSRPGAGTVFNVYFPAHDGEITERTHQFLNIPSGRGQRILVVDDELPLVQMTGKILNKLGYAAETMCDPVAALALIRAEPSKYELIITDLTMPGMTGLEFASCALEANSQLLIILMTGFFATMTSEQIRATGIKEVVLKPITIRSLGEMIDRVLKQESLPS